MELIREVPDTSLASLFDGEPMVQSFAVAGRRGRVWITTAEALTVPGVRSGLGGRPARGAARRARCAGLQPRPGLRHPLHAEQSAALPLAA